MTPENLQPAIEFIINNGEAFAGFLLIGAISLSWKQRQAIRQRDNFECQANGNIQHGGRLEVDHIIPKEFAEKALKLRPEQYNHPNNLLTKCQNHHRGHPDSHHPDMHVALDSYQHGDHEAIAKAAHEHTEKAKKGQVYWNNAHDAEDRKTAIENSKKEDQRRGGRRSWWPWG